MKKTSLVLFKNYGLLSFILMMCAVFVLGIGATSVQAAKKTDVPKGISAGLVDINNASEKELEAVKGVGPATAKKIVANRPYQSVDELSKAGLKPKAIEAMKPFVSVGKASAAPVKASTAPVAAATAKAAAKATIPAAAVATNAPKTAAPAPAYIPKAAKEVKATSKAASAGAAKLAPGTRININTADQATIEKLPEIGAVKAKAIIDGRPYKAIEDVMKIKGIKGKTFDAIKDYIVVK